MEWLVVLAASILAGSVVWVARDMRKRRALELRELKAEAEVMEELRQMIAKNKAMQMKRMWDQDQAALISKNQNEKVSEPLAQKLSYRDLINIRDDKEFKAKAAQEDTLRLDNQEHEKIKRKAKEDAKKRRDEEDEQRRRNESNISNSSNSFSGSSYDSGASYSDSGSSSDYSGGGGDFSGGGSSGDW